MRLLHRRSGQPTALALLVPLGLAHCLSTTPLRRVPPGTPLRDAVGLAQRRLETAGDPEADIAALHLVAHASGERGPASLRNLKARLADGGQTLDEQAADVLDDLLSRRGNTREPVQYLLGEWDFHLLPQSLRVRRPVLVPRPETEELVDKVLAHVRQVPGAVDQPLRVLDVGSGTGAIGLALVHALPHLTCVAIDKSADAVALANENAELLGLAGRFQCLHQSLADFVRAPNDGGAEFAGFDLVVSNPPYIPARDMDGLPPEVADFEDHDALCGGEDGLDVVRELLAALPTLLRSELAGGGCMPGTLWLEVDPSHPPLLDALLQSAAGDPRLSRLKFVRAMGDFAGLPRFCLVGTQPTASDTKAAGGKVSTTL